MKNILITVITLISFNTFAQKWYSTEINNLNIQFYLDNNYSSKYFFDIIDIRGDMRTTNGYLSGSNIQIRVCKRADDPSETGCFGDFYGEVGIENYKGKFIDGKLEGTGKYWGATS